MAHVNRLYGAGWALFGATVLIASWRMDRLESLNVNPWSAPGVMPGVLGLLMLVFGAALALRKRGQDPFSAEKIRTPLSGRRTAVALVLCLVFAAGLLGRGLPFWLTSAGFLFVSTFAFRLMDAEGEAPIWRFAASSAAIAIAAALVISFVFQDLFLVRLP